MKPFGLRGEIHAFSLTEFPQLRFKKGQRVYLRKPGEEPLPLTIRSARIQGDALILGFEECPSVESVEGFRGLDLDMDKSEAALPEGYFRFADLIGCAVYDEEGNRIGVVDNLTSYAPTKNLKIKKDADGKFFYVPFKESFVPIVDIEAKRIVLHVVEGML